MRAALPWSLGSSCLAFAAVCAVVTPARAAAAEPTDTASSPFVALEF